MGLAVLIDRGAFRVASDRKVLKADEVTTVRDVAKIFASADEHLARRRAETEAECAQRVLEGFRYGMDRGSRDAVAQLAGVEVRRAALLESLRPALAELVMQAIAMLAKQIDRKSLIAQALDTLRAPLQNASWAVLRVHPDAVTSAQAALDEFVAAHGVGALARVVPDGALPVDGAVFESEFGKIDASLDTQLAAIRSAIERATATITDEVPSETATS